VKAVPFGRQFGLSTRPFQPSGPRRAFCFGTRNHLRDKEPASGQGTNRDGNQTGTGNQGAAGASVYVSGFLDGNHCVRQRGTKFSTTRMRQPTIHPGALSRIERDDTASSVGGKGNQFKVCVRAVSRRTIRPSFLGVHRSRPPCSRQMRRSARLPALATTARSSELRSPIGTLPGGSDAQLNGDTRCRLRGKPETRHGGCRPEATVKQRPMELV
jgi:hypothetical protein